VFESLSHTLPSGHAVGKVVGACGFAGGMRDEWNRSCMTKAGGRAEVYSGTHAWLQEQACRYTHMHKRQYII